MKILLIAIGTRGDMEPFLAVGELLKLRGEDVTCLFPEQFRNLAEDSDMHFESFGSEFMNLLNSKEGKAVMGGSNGFFVKARAMIRLAVKFRGVNKRLVARQKEVIDRLQPDRVVYHGKATYPVLWALSNPGRNILLTPVPFLHYVEGHSHLGFKAKDYGSLINRLSYKLAEFGLTQSIMASAKWAVEGKVTSAEIKDIMATSKTIYAISPSLFPQPKSWPEHFKVMGYHERNKVVNWEPAAELEAFLNSHSKVVLLTFGSMVNPHPDQKTRVFMEVLEELNIPALINTSSGGLIEPEEYNAGLFHFVDQIPYDWVLPKIYAVIHHGGSGTTHMGLKHGCPTLIIPHIIDQFVWDRLVYERGAGPKGVDISSVSRGSIYKKVEDLYTNASYPVKAGEIADQMKSEDYGEALYRKIVKANSQHKS